MTLPLETIMSVLKVSTYIITSIPARSIGPTAILTIMFVSTFITAVILCIAYRLIVITIKYMQMCRKNEVRFDCWSTCPSQTASKWKIIINFSWCKQSKIKRFLTTLCLWWMPLRRNCSYQRFPTSDMRLGNNWSCQ